jgi:uncharacterized protein (DUF433 family)
MDVGPRKTMESLTNSIVNDLLHPVPLTLSADDVIRVGGTRVTLDTVIGAFQDGATPEEIVYRYPSLQLADVYTVIGYYLRHTELVAVSVSRRERQVIEARRQNEQRFFPHGIRERLLSRHSSPSA